MDLHGCTPRNQSQYFLPQRVKYRNIRMIEQIRRYNSAVSNYDHILQDGKHEASGADLSAEKTEADDAITPRYNEDGQAMPGERRKWHQHH